MFSWLILITHYCEGGGKNQHKDPSSESLSTAPSAHKSSSPILLLSRLRKKKARPQVWHTVQTPDSVFVRLLMASAAGGVGSAANISPRECFPKQSIESHQWGFFGQDKSVGADWELSLTLRARRKEQIEPGTNEGSEWLCDPKCSELHNRFISALVKLCCCWMTSRSERFIGKLTFPPKCTGCSYYTLSNFFFFF